MHKIHLSDKFFAVDRTLDRRIPSGWVATYGQVAKMAGMPRRGRLVGRVLQRFDPAIKIPWHRVVNAKGEVSYSLSRNGGDPLQRRSLVPHGMMGSADSSRTHHALVSR